MSIRIGWFRAALPICTFRACGVSQHAEPVLLVEW